MKLSLPFNYDRLPVVLDSTRGITKSDLQLSLFPLDLHFHVLVEIVNLEESNIDLELSAAPSIL